MKWLEKIEEVPKKYRPIPFWSWNDKLESDMLKWQISEMDKAGIGGFFMHARGGLKTPYMGDDWMKFTEECIVEAEKYGMDAWCYDEEGWPSGVGGGVVANVNEEYHLRWLKFDKATNKIEIKSNKYYVDLLNKACVAEFIKSTHIKYKEKLAKYFNGSLVGFFTDEPQYARGQIPWSPVIPAEFKKKYGYEVADILPLLFIEGEDYKKHRYNYWNLVSELFTEAFSKQIFEWCRENNTQFTGHLMEENNLGSQMGATAGVMPSYEYMDMPGMDWLCRRIDSPVIPKQVSSVAEQMGINRVLTETFALCGWGVTFEELKWIAQWQYVNGVNMMCQHLEGYSLAGERKRDYPPGMFYQQPWWNEYKSFNDYFSRLGAILRDGEVESNLLLIHPMKSAYLNYNGDRASINELDEKFLALSQELNDLQMPWHYGDETIIKKYGKYELGKIIVGKCSYNGVILPKCETLDQYTVEILLDFAKNGGKIVAKYGVPTLCEGAEDAIMLELAKYVIETDTIREELETLCVLKCDNKNLHYTSRRFGNETLYYIVNNHKAESYSEKILIKNIDNISALSIEDMQYYPVEFSVVDGGVEVDLDFAPMQAYVLVTGVNATNEMNKDYKTISITDQVKIDEISLNSITLDFCQYRLNGGDWQDEIAVINLKDELLNARANGNLELKFAFESNIEISKAFLVVETPEKFDIKFNGDAVEYVDCGWWIDSSFKKVEIKNIKKGMNEIVLSCNYFQRQKVYDILLGENVHESETNKLTLDTELESVYIIGDFGVYSKSDYTFGERKAIFTGKDFYLDTMPNKLKADEFTTQGLPFFAGDITVSKAFNLDKVENTILDISNINAITTVVFVNGEKVKNISWAPYHVDITNYLKQGENNIALKLYSSCRNLLGPHHHIAGECYIVATTSFGSKTGWADSGLIDTIWRDDGYCFIKFGL